jgi:ABC-type phosphate transport system substrate-binding protein
MTSRRKLWFLIRIAVYLAVIVGLILARGGVPWRQFKTALKGAGDKHPTLTLVGRDLAPPLVERLATEYQRDYPALTVDLLPGGTNQALDALLAREADVAFLLRPPTAAEQELFRQADGDTAVVVAIGVGGLVLLAGTEASVGPLTVDALRAALAAPGEASVEPERGLAPYCSRLYACDPNEGSWDALGEVLGLAGADDAAGAPAQGGATAQISSQVVFLANPAAVIAAVAADPTSWGLVSTLDAGVDPTAGPPAGTRFVGVVASSDQTSVAPTGANVATGGYPLHHFLYAACRGSGSLEGGKFVTHLASARGLRQVERAGVIPAKLVARTIQLSHDPVSAGSPKGDDK